MALTLAAPIIPVHFWTDCTAAMSIANGTAASSGPGLSFALCQVAEQGRSWTWNWVPSHRRHLFNELADIVAKRSAAGLLAGSPWPSSFIQLFQHPLHA